MKIIRNTIPVSDIYNQLMDGNLTINRSYQRSPGLWPENARSYFIDTILNDFPFPKIIIRQSIDLKTKKTKREIIDGQQRLLTIRDFLNNNFKLSKVSKNYPSYYFNDLEEDIQNKLLAYEISSDNIISASEEEVLEIFRRINSYTLPLSKTEQRHATFQGEFKWFVSNLSEYFTPFLDTYKVLSIRQISRMEDADLITELTQVIIEGITSRSTSKLENLYKKYDTAFNDKERYNVMIIDTLEFIKTNLSDLFETYKIPAYNFYSIFSALIFNKYGFQKNNNPYFIDFAPIGVYVKDINQSKLKLFELFEELENRYVVNTENSSFITASLATTHSLNNRSIRISKLIEIFRTE